MIWFHTDSGSLFRFPHHCGIGVGRFSSIYNTSTSRFLRLQPRYTLATKSTVAKAGDKSATKSTVDFTPICRRFVESLPSCKVTPFFDTEYLRNGTRYRHTFNGILTGTCTCPSQQCHFEWPWVILNDLLKYSMTWNVARSLRQLSFLSITV